MPVGFWEAYAHFFFVICALYVLFGLDDLFIDLVAWSRELRPTPFTPAELREIETLREKRLALLVPAWNEGAIIGKMLRGNLSTIQYRNYDFFVGAYPNDADTIEAILRVRQTFPQVHLVVNRQPGPTSKGQMLNEIIHAVKELESKARFLFAGVVLHDSEDIIHPRSLTLINSLARENDFVQLPVFSFPIPAWRLVAGTYVDEFAESHTKDLLVREALGAAVPSAGVGTFLSRKLVDRILLRDGRVFNPDSLTEDYELGLKAYRLGFRGAFSCRYFLRDEYRGYVATREFFPRTLKTSVRQKGRWTAGIALQGTARLGWFGSLANRYFLFRDRKGIFCHGLNFLAYAYSLSLAPLAWLGWISVPPMALPVGGVTMAFMVHRYHQRVIAVRRVYGSLQLFRIAVRIPVANVINALATLRAIVILVAAYFADNRVRWSKTEHELPALFGDPAWEGA